LGWVLPKNKQGKGDGDSEEKLAAIKGEETIPGRKKTKKGARNKQGNREVFRRKRGGGDYLLTKTRRRRKKGGNRGVKKVAVKEPRKKKGEKKKDAHSPVGEEKDDEAPWDQTWIVNCK